MDNRILQLQQDMSATLRKAERIRKMLKICQYICYGGALFYLIFIFGVQGLIFSGAGSSFIHDYEANPNPTFWEANRMLMLILPVIALVTIGSAGLGYFYKHFTATEQSSVRRIVREMFPDAKTYIETSEVSALLLTASNFFGQRDEDDGFGSATSFGSIVFNNEGQNLAIRDIVVNGTSTDRKIAGTQLGAMAVALRMLFGALFAKRVESAASSFRGLFAYTRLAKNINGSVVILPDRLERHLDYLAKSIQSLKNVNGNKLVMLEDVEFERYFAVYSTDEVLARYVLTPAMMRRMTDLRKKYNRDVMLSFNGDAFFFAVAMPEGFLTLGKGKAAAGGLYDHIVASREILKDLKLDKIPDTTIRL